MFLVNCPSACVVDPLVDLVLFSRSFHHHLPTFQLSAGGYVLRSLSPADSSGLTGASAHQLVRPRGVLFVSSNQPVFVWFPPSRSLGFFPCSACAFRSCGWRFGSVALPSASGSSRLHHWRCSSALCIGFPPVLAELFPAKAPEFILATPFFISSDRSPSSCFRLCTKSRPLNICGFNFLWLPSRLYCLFRLHHCTSFDVRSSKLYLFLASGLHHFYPASVPCFTPLRCFLPLSNLSFAFVRASSASIVYFPL